MAASVEWRREVLALSEQYNFLIIEGEPLTLVLIPVLSCPLLLNTPAFQMIRTIIYTMGRP